MKQSLKTAGIAFAVTLLLFVTGFAAYQIVGILGSTAKSENATAEIRKQFEVKSPDESPTESPAESELPQFDWDRLKQKYPGIRGWLYCPDTKLDHPLVQGQDNSYYLSHLATGESNKHGVIFVDCRNGTLLEDENTILYGHNMNDGTMFHGLLDWSNAYYAATHPTLYLLTPHKVYELKVFNACVVTADSPEYQLDFTTTSKAAWLDQCARHSFFTADFVPDADDPVVTFSTCSSKNHWFVVQASATEIEPDAS